MTSADKRLAQIQALLAKAEKTSFPEEAKTFSAKAFELMEKWSIDEATVAAARHEASTNPESMRIDVPYSPFKGPKVTLINRLAPIFDCRAIFTNARIKNFGEERKQHGAYRHIGYATVVGFPHDLRMLEMMYTSLLLQSQVEFQSEQVQWRMAGECDHPGKRTAWRNSFQDGFNSEVLSRLNDMKRATRKDATDATPGVGLVLASKTDQVAKRYNEMFPETMKGAKSNRSFKASAYNEGQKAGARANVGTPAPAASSRKEVR